MQRMCIRDRDHFFQVDVLTTLPFDVWQDDRAEPLIRVAMLMSLAALLEGGEWPSRALYTLREFMFQMHAAVNGGEEGQE